MTPTTYKQRTYEPVEYRRWEHISGRTASAYGACPWHSDRDRADWTLATRGWTVRNRKTGTIGICHQPWATRAEAQAWIDAVE